MDLYNRISDQLKEIGLGNWADIEDIKNVYESVSSLESGQIYLEIGVAHGASLAVACLAAKEGVNIYGLDTLNWEDRTHNVQKMLDLHVKKHPWVFMDGDSQMLAKSWNKGPIHALYIDGDHTFEGVCKDLVSWLPHVAKGGKIFFDDYNLKTGVMKAVDSLIYNHNSFTDQVINGESFICTKAW